MNLQQLLSQFQAKVAPMTGTATRPLGAVAAETKSLM